MEEQWNDLFNDMIAAGAIAIVDDPSADGTGPKPGGARSQLGGTPLGADSLMAPERKIGRKNRIATAVSSNEMPLEFTLRVMRDSEQPLTGCGKRF